MLAGIGKYVGGRVLTAVLVVASAAGIIWFWKHPEQLTAIWAVLRKVLIWLGLALVLPWSTFFATGWVVRKESNALAGLLLGGLAAVDVLIAFSLVDRPMDGALTWLVVLLGLLCAAVYNFLVCDLQAGWYEDRL